MKGLPSIVYSRAKGEYIPSVKPIENWKSGIKKFYEKSAWQQVF